MTEEQTKKKAALFIDGSNLYKRLQYSGIRKGNIDYAQFSRNLILDRHWVGTYFYIAPVRKQDGVETYQAQQRFFSALRGTKGINLKLGTLVKRQNECGQCGYRHEFLLEKGVDVQLAVDMIAMASQDAYDVAYLVSADSDFIPAVEMIRYDYKKQVFCVAPKGAKYGKLGNACNTAIPIDQSFIDGCQV